MSKEDIIIQQAERVQNYIWFVAKSTFYECNTGNAHKTYLREIFPSSSKLSMDERKRILYHMSLACYIVAENSGGKAKLAQEIRSNWGKIDQPLLDKKIKLVFKSIPVWCASFNGLAEKIEEIFLDKLLGGAK